jgi:hypothetical protein
VLRYSAQWSDGNDVEGLAAFYADTVSFYGDEVGRDKVMDEKRRFSRRWPVRHYTVRTNTLFAQCSDICSVSGVVEWDASSAERAARSTGSANFVLRIVPGRPGLGEGRIVSENGAVLASHIEPLTAVPAAPVAPVTSIVPAVPTTASGIAALSPEQRQAAMTPAYADGRQARATYEQWYAALPAGPYRDGATFWAAHRTDRPPPVCAAGPPGEWQRGCNDGRAILARSDALRRADRNFWWGWNSL